MSKMVGLSRNLKMTWLNKAVELLSENLPEAEYKNRLNEYLSFEIKSAINIRKTREILMHVWYYDNTSVTPLRSEALTLIQKDSDNALLCHWCLLLAGYPVFVDICSLIGKLSEFENEIILAQIKQKIFDEWGERATLYHSIDKIIATMKNIGVLHTEKAGRYKIIWHDVTKPEAISFLISTIICLENKGYCTLRELSEKNYMFPFRYQIKREMFLTDENFTITNVAGELIVSLKKTSK